MFLTPRADAVIRGLVAWWVAAVLLGVVFKAIGNENAPWPVSLIALVLLVGAPVWLAIVIGRRRYRELMGRFPLGQCQRCGYDLTGNVSGVCPECGASV